jgi:hypothetical protein
VRYIFLKVFAPGVEVSVASARDGSFDPEHWWERRKSVKDFLVELVGMVAAVWELRHEGGQGEKSAGMSRVLVLPMDQNGTKSVQKSSLALYMM